MKKSFFLLLLFAFPAHAQVQFNIPGMTPDQQSALTQLMGPLLQAQAQAQSCIEGQLGADGMTRVQTTAKQLNSQIVPLCKSGQKEQAHLLAERYAETDEGRAVIKCGQQQKALLDNPSSSKLLGKYATMVRTTVDTGRVPEDVCTGLDKPKQPKLPLTPPGR